MIGRQTHSVPAYKTPQHNAQHPHADSSHLKIHTSPLSAPGRPAPRQTTHRNSIVSWSPSRLATLYIESSDSFVASAAVSIATGWSEPVSGRELHPLKSSAFSRRTVTPAESDHLENER
jgi:hypothetical protein